MTRRPLPDVNHAPGGLPPTSHERLRRRYGYRFRAAKPTPIRSLLSELRVRVVPLNRAYPADSTSVGDCPLCGALGKFYVERGEETWSCLDCRPRGGDAFALLLAVARQRLTS